MKSKIISILLVFVFIVPSSLAFGQLPQQNEPTIAQLEGIIARQEAVERDPTTQPEVRKLNREFLDQNRQKLRELKNDKLSSLQQYLTNFRAMLTPAQVLQVETAIKKFQQDSSQTSGAITSEAEGNRSSSSTEVGLLGTDTNAAAAVTAASGSPAPATSGSIPGGETSQPVPVIASASLVRAASAPLNVPIQDFPDPQDCAAYAASPASFSLYEKYVCDLITRTAGNKAAGNRLIQLDGPQGFNLVVILMAQKLRSTFLVDAEEARVDKQVGAPSSNSGSTSLVTKGGTPAILGFAVENGALERNITGTTVTFRGNPVGLIDALKNKGFMSSFEDDSPATHFLRKTSFAFSFDTSRGEDPGVFTAKKQQLSSVSGRIELINRRDPRDRAYRTDWENFLATNAQAFVGALVQFKGVLSEVVPGTGVGLIPAQFRYKDQALQDWYVETEAAVAAAAPGNVETVFKAQLAKLPVSELSEETVASLTNVARQFGVYLQGRQRILDRVAKGTIATFEYTNKREVTAPDTSNFMGIYETSFGGSADFTFNGALTMFNKRPIGPNARRIRDFQFSGQLDFPFGDVNGAGQFVLSASGRYERLMQLASTDTGAVVPNANGDIAIGQVKLTIPIKGLGIKLPISMTFANRTELIKEKEVRGNFGVTFDLDTLFAKFKPF